MHRSGSATALVGFLLLFCCYHAAEYMILFQNSPVGFLLFSGLFTLTAYLLAKVQLRQGMYAWFLQWNRRFALDGLTGLLVGLAAYGTGYMLQLVFGVEVVNNLSFSGAVLANGVLLAFGSFCSSFTEDLLTRAFVFRQLQGKVRPMFLVLASAAIYTINHIYRLHEPVYLFFIFITGLHLAIPLLLLRNIWYTVGIHWAGNIIYHFTTSVLQSQPGAGAVSAYWVMVPVALLLIPVNLYCCRLLAAPEPEERWAVRKTGVRRLQAVIHRH